MGIQKRPVGKFESVMRKLKNKLTKRDEMLKSKKARKEK